MSWPYRGADKNELLDHLYRERHRSQVMLRLVVLLTILLATSLVTLGVAAWEHGSELGTLRARCGLEAP